MSSRSHLPPTRSHCHGRRFLALLSTGVRIAALNGAFSQQAYQYPLHFLIAADFDNRTLVAGADDDGIIFTVIVDAVDMRQLRPAHYLTYPRICRRNLAPPDLLRSTRMAGLAGIDIQAHSADRGFHYHHDKRIRISNRRHSHHYPPF